MKTYYAFSLVELLLVLLLLSSLFISIPYFSGVLEKQKVKSEIEKFAHACEFARQIALIRNEVISICHSKSKKQCDGNWNDGFIIFSDSSGSHLIDKNNKILRSYHNKGNLPGHFLWHGFLSEDYLAFNYQGFDLGMAGRFEFIPQPGKENLAMHLVVNNGGRIYLVS